MGKKIRTYADLIAEATEEGRQKKSSMLQIVIGFTDDLKFVTTGESEEVFNKLTALTKARGGEPLVLIGWMVTERNAQLYRRLFEESVGEEWLEKFFGRLFTEMQGLAEKIARVVRQGDPEEN